MIVNDGIARMLLFEKYLGNPAFSYSMKRVLATIAIMAMVINMFPINAFAATGVATGRIGGMDRFQTANLVADTFGTATTAILAPAADANLVDALVAAPLAGKTSPILSY